MHEFTIHMPASEEHRIISELPIYNTFREMEKQNFMDKNSVYLLFVSITFITLFLFSIDWGFIEDARNRRFDRMAVTVVDFGDFVSLSRKRVAINYVEIDEVFGNEFIKEKDKLIDPDSEEATNDPRIAGAVNPIVGNATAPIDLNPEVTPDYTAKARAAGIEGVVILELVITDDGKVLRARPVGKKLGHGLDESAARCYRHKRFKPSLNSDGKRITVKIFQPVKFVLM